MRIDRDQAIALLRAAAKRSSRNQGDSEWIAKVERLSRLCEEGVSKTHIAFLVTAMLAKAVDQRADLYAIKPEHAPQNPNAFSARSLCHSVIVPLAAELGFNLGVTGREPLNNQPYFRMTRLDDGTPVHSGGRRAFDYMVKLVKELNESDAATARRALQAFVTVRRKYQPRYLDLEGESQITPAQLADLIVTFIRANSEGGRRAQAVVAGLLDVFAGPERVESGRINDPSRKYPGDVCVRSLSNPAQWEKAFEVRDKPVTASDVQIFGKKCVDMGVREAAVVMASNAQPSLDRAALEAWATGFGIGLMLFEGWASFVEQVLFWSELPQPIAANRATRRIHERLIAVEASPAAVELWGKLVGA